MILAFKVAFCVVFFWLHIFNEPIEQGTTYQKEVNTDKAFFTVQPREGVLYDEPVHRGMYQGMFERFPGYENIGDAFGEHTLH